MTTAEPPQPGVSPAGSPRISASGVTVEKGGRVVVRDVSVDVAAGEVLGVLGPSGAGKSTFFGALVGEEPLLRGRVSLDGRDVTRLPLWQRARLGLGYIPQTPSVLWDLSVRDNFRTFFRVGLGRDGDVTKAAERVGLLGRLDVPAGSLSGGERRRLELGRALTVSPRVLVCDEPFAGVDPQGAAHLGDLLVALARDGTAVLLADHHVEEALRVCTRALLLLDGSVVDRRTGYFPRGSARPRPIPRDVASASAVAHPGQTEATRHRARAHDCRSRRADGVIPSRSAHGDQATAKDEPAAGDDAAAAAGDSPLAAVAPRAD